MIRRDPAAAPDRLLCFDFDGTLVDSARGEPIEPELERRIAELRENGAAWVVNTGRTLEFALEGLHAHGFNIEPDFLIVEETALLHQPDGSWSPLGDWVERRDLAHREVEERGREFFHAVRTRVERQPGAEYLSRDRAPDEIISQDEAQMDRFSEFIDMVREDLGMPDISYQRNGIYLRFGHCDFCKGATLRELSLVLGLGPERVFAAGDNHNDLTMLSRENAHAIACPSNALPIVRDSVREQGGFVASRPHGHGLLEALTFFFG